MPLRGNRDEEFRVLQEAQGGCGPEEMHGMRRLRTEVLSRGIDAGTGKAPGAYPPANGTSGSTQGQLDILSPADPRGLY